MHFKNLFLGNGVRVTVSRAKTLIEHFYRTCSAAAVFYRVFRLCMHCDAMSPRIVKYYLDVVSNFLVKD